MSITRTARSRLTEFFRRYPRLAQRHAPPRGRSCLTRLAATLMEASNVVHRLRHLLKGKGRLTVHLVPRREKLERDLEIDLMPEQVARQRCDRAVALAFGNSAADKLSPMIEGVTDPPMPGEPREPLRQLREPRF